LLKDREMVIKSSIFLVVLMILDLAEHHGGSGLDVAAQLPNLPQKLVAFKCCPESSFN